MLNFIVLGAAAGGGFPQWNANNEACRRARSGDVAALVRTQSSLAVSVDGERWLILNASPDIGRQILATQELHPRRGLRHSPIAAVALTNADVDHVAGLLTLRERHPLSLYATGRILDVLAENTIFDVLDRNHVTRRAMRLDTPFEPVDARGDSLGIEVEAFAVAGKAALYKEDRSAADFGTLEGDTIGLALRAVSSPERTAFYIPGCAAVTSALRSRLRGAALLFFDGTLWRDDEMVVEGSSDKTGQRMGHISISGADGSMTGLDGLEIADKIYIHLNNSNPVLLSDSAAYRHVCEHGWRVAYDGLAVSL